jgi:uncharacterized protein
LSPVLSKLAQSPAPVRIGAFLLALVLLWLPIVIPAYLLLSDQNSRNLLTLPALYFEFVLLVRWWGQRVYGQPKMLRHYGLEFSRRSGWELAGGWVASASSLLVVLAIEAGLGWLNWKSPGANWLGIVLEGSAIGLAFGCVEELLFRGWLLDELQRDYSPQFALWGNAIGFACLHFIRPVAEILRLAPQFPALVLLGLALVWAKRSRQNRLALPIGIHAGLVGTFYTLNVGGLIQFPDRVPEWMTGIDRNPLAGVVGIVFLGGWALAMRRLAIGMARHPL